MAAVLLLAGCASAGSSTPKPAVAEAMPRSLTAQVEPSLASAMEPALDQAIARAERRALDYSQSDRPASFRVAQVSGDVSVSVPYRVASRTCRRFVTTLRGTPTGGPVEGTACLQGDRWTLVPS